MKHEVTTHQTKQLMANALKRIMRNKPFSKITVSEIIQDCGINRKTFYYHFQDIYALLQWVLDEEAIQIVRHFDLLDNYEDAIRFIMDYVRKNDYIINCSYDSMSRGEMKRFFFKDSFDIIFSVISEAEAQTGLPLDPSFKTYVAKFYTEALAGMLIDWAVHGSEADQEQTVHYLTLLISASMECGMLTKMNKLQK